MSSVGLMLFGVGFVSFRVVWCRISVGFVSLNAVQCRINFGIMSDYWMIVGLMSCIIVWCPVSLYWRLVPFSVGIMPD